MGKKAVIDVGIRIDVKDQLRDIANQIDALAASAGKGISKATANEMSEIKGVIKDIQSQVDKINYGKVSTKTFEAANKTIMSQIENLEKRTSALELGMKGLIDTMSQAEGGKFAGELANLSTLMSNFTQDTRNALEVAQEFQKTVQKSGGTANIVNDKDVQKLEEEKNKLEAIMGLISGKRRSSVKIPTGDFKALDKTINAAIKAYEELEELESSKSKKNKNQGRILELQRELGIYYSKLKDVLNNKDFKLSGQLADSFNEEFTHIEQILKSRESSIRERINSITEMLSSSTAEAAKGISNTGGAEYNEEKNKVTVPMKISTSPTTLLKEAERIIDSVNANLKNEPLEIEFKLISGYSSKKTNQALKQFQGEIDALEDGLVKDEFQDIYNKIAKDFNKEIALKVDTKHIKDAAEETKKLMTQIQKTLNDKLAIHPRVEFTSEETAMIQASLDKVADNITLTINNITLSDEVTQKLEKAIDKKQIEAEKELAKAATKKEKSKKKDTLDTAEATKLKEITQSIESATGSLAAKLDEINSGSLQPIILSLKQIGQMINVLGQQAGSLPEVFDDITGSLETMLTALQRGLGVKTGGELDAQFNALKTRVGDVKGDLRDPVRAKTRNPRVEELKEIIRLYKEYQSLGGKKSVESLGGADNVQRWLKKHINDEVAPQETTEISKVEEAVDSVSKKVDTKNEKFKEEASVVKAVASDEVKSLQNVVDVLQQMFENLAKINQRGFTSWKNADWKQAISDALTEIDKIEMKLSEGKELGSIKVQVEPLIDPIDFANKVTSALSGVNAEINLVPSFNPNEIGNEIGKLLNSQVASDLKRDTYADIIRDMISADKLMQASGKEIRERGMYFNTITGYHTTAHTFDEPRSYSLSEELYKSALEEVNAYIHTHPDKISTMSLAGMQNGKLSGDIIAAAQSYIENIEQQIIAAQDEVTIFDAKSFFDKYEDKVYNIDSNGKKRVKKDFALKMTEVNAIASQLAATQFEETIDAFNSDSLSEMDKLILPKTSYDGVSFMRSSNDSLFAQMNSIVRSKGNMRDNIVGWLSNKQLQQSLRSISEKELENGGIGVNLKTYLDMYLTKALENDFSAIDIEKYLNEIEKELSKSVGGKPHPFLEAFYEAFDDQSALKKNQAKAFEIFDKYAPNRALGIDDWDKYFETFSIDDFVNKINKDSSELKEISGWSEAGKKIVSDFVSGIETGLEEVQSSMNKIVDTATQSLRESVSQFEQIGKEAGEAFSGALRNTEEEKTPDLVSSSQFTGKTQEELQLGKMLNQDKLQNEINETSDALKEQQNIIGDVIQELHNLTISEQNEYGLFFNSKNNNYERVIGEKDKLDINSVADKVIAKQFDSFFHTHTGPLGAFGADDIMAILQGQMYDVMYQYVLSSTSALKLDVSKIKPQDLEKIANQYNDAYIESFADLKNNATLKDIFGPINKVIDEYSSFIENAMGDIKSPFYTGMNVTNETKEFLVSSAKIIDDNIIDYIKNNWNDLSTSVFEIGNLNIQKQIANELANVFDLAPSQFNTDEIKKQVSSSFNELMGLYKTIAEPEIFDAAFDEAIHQNSDFVKDFANMMNTYLEELVKSYGGSLTKFTVNDFLSVFGDPSSNIGKFAGKTQEELEQCLKKEEMWLARCKEGSDRYKERKANIEEINSLLGKTVTETDATDSAVKTAEASQEENEAFTKVSESAQEASEAKQKFAEANAEVLSSISESLTGLKDEAGAFDTIVKALGKLNKIPSDALTQIALGLIDIRDALGTPLGETTFLDGIRDIVNSGVDIQALADVLYSSRDQLEKAKQILGESDNKPLIQHGEASAFLHPDTDATEWLRVADAAEEYKNELEEIVTIQRNVKADRVSYSVTGKNGNGIILAENSEGGWAVSSQYLTDRRKEIKEEEKLQRDYTKLFDEAESKQVRSLEEVEKARIKSIDKRSNEERKIVEQQAKAINKAQEEAYKKRFQTEEMYAKLFDEAELKRRKKEKKQAEDSIKEQEKLDKEYGKLFNQVEAKQKKLVEQMGKASERSQINRQKEVDKAEKRQATAINKDQEREYKERVKSVQELDSYIEKSRKLLSPEGIGKKEITQGFTEQIEKARTELEELYSLVDSHKGSQGEILSFSDDELRRINEIREGVDKVKDSLSEKVNADSISKLLTKIGTDLSDNTRMVPELRERFLLLRETIDETRKSAEGIDQVSFKNFTNEFMRLHEEMVRTQQTGKSFFQSIAEAARSQTVQLIGRYFSLQDWIRYAQQGFEMVKSIDSALTELRKVSDASTSRLAENFEKSSKAAQDLGHSISGVINITADWARLNITGLIYSNV